MSALGAGVDYIDLEFLGQTGIIATAILRGPGGIALIDPGPSTTIPALTRAIEARGFALRDIRAILLTHIHLDHAGATGSLIAECPDAEVHVHQRGATHLIDPSKLLVSAARLYGDDMERLWGEVRAVPADRVRPIGDRADLEVLGHEVTAAYTPGHASHHVSYFLPAARVAFVGDTAGICRPQGRTVLPATPPPDVDLEAWRTSTARILAWKPEWLFLTHFGPQPSPRVHFQDFWRRMDNWSSRVRAAVERGGGPEQDAALAQAFMDEVERDLVWRTNRDEAQGYARAARFDFSWAGLARYWRRRL